MPGLKGKDLSSGPKVFQHRTPPRKPKHSTIVCPVCGYPLHVYLVDDGIRIHPLCQPERHIA